MVIIRASQKQELGSGWEPRLRKQNEKKTQGRSKTSRGGRGHRGDKHSQSRLKLALISANDQGF